MFYYSEKEECLDQLIPEYLGLYVDMDIIDMGKVVLKIYILQLTD